MLTDAAIEYIRGTGRTDGLRLACQATQPRSMGARASAAYRRLLRAFGEACAEDGQRWAALSADERDAVLRWEARQYALAV